MTKQSLHNKRIKLLKKFNGTYTVIKPRSKRHCHQLLLAIRDAGFNVNHKWNSFVLATNTGGFYICLYKYSYKRYNHHPVGVYTHNCDVEHPETMI